MKKKEQVREVHVSFVRRLRLTEKICVVCQRRFTGVKKSLYCGKACKNRADYAKHAPERRSARMEKHRKEKGQKAQ